MGRAHDLIASGALGGATCASLSKIAGNDSAPGISELDLKTELRSTYIDIEQTSVVGLVGQCQVEVVGICLALECQEVECVQDIEGEHSDWPEMGRRK